MAEAPAVDAPGREVRSGPLGPVGTLVLVALTVAGFFLASVGSERARAGLKALAGRPAAPPAFGILDPGFAVTGVVPLLVALGGAGLVVVALRRSVRPVLWVGGALAFMLAFAAAVPLVQESPNEAVGGVRSIADVRRAKAMGVREFVRVYPGIASTLENPHSRTHPGGRTAFLAFLDRAAGGRVAPRAAFLAFLSALCVVPLWFLGRRLAGEEVARLAVLLYAFAPGPVLFALASMDAIHATIFTAALALLASGGVWDDRGRLPLAFAGGLVLGLSTFLTFAGIFIAILAGFLTVVRRPLGDAVRALAVAALGGVVALALLRLGLGFDLVAHWRGSHAAVMAHLNLERDYWYWQAGNAIVWTAFAGLPIAALALRELVARRPPYLVLLLAPLAIFYALPESVTGIIGGETERTLLYAYPLAAIAAGSGLARWAGHRPRAVAGLLALAGAQAVLLEALYLNFW